MIYHPVTGAMWDPSIIWHEGMYYAFMMYSRDTNNGLEAEHCLLAVSADGVHWRDESIVLEEREREKGYRFFKCSVGRCGDRFIMSHGVLRTKEGAQDILRFYESFDLRHWTYLFSSSPDPRWYKTASDKWHRWDAMYILPKEEDNPQGGFWGYLVSAPRSGDADGVGMMESPDGRTWEVLPPAPFDWQGLPACPSAIEYGGCERIEGKYYLIGGYPEYLDQKGYSMFTFIAENPKGPFVPDQPAFRLCGCSHKLPGRDPLGHITWLAAWCRGKGELLISNYASVSGSGDPWLLPFRKPFIDADHHLRLGWWKGNENLKGDVLSLKSSSLLLDHNTASGTSTYNHTYLDPYLDLSFTEDTGVVLEGYIRARATGSVPAAGIMIAEGPSQAMAVLLGIGKPDTRVTNIGRLVMDHETNFEVLDVTGKYCATVTGIEEDKRHFFRLLIRIGLFELYIDDKLMQTFFYKPGNARIGLVAHNATAQLSDLKAWRMSL